MQNLNLGPPEKTAALWETRVLGIEGMTCDHCARTVTRALQQVCGIKEVRVDRHAARAEITFDRTQTGIPAIHAAILRCGFKPTGAVPAD